MDKIAFIFSGQGDQRVGMGEDLYETFPEAKSVFDVLEAISPGTIHNCFSSDEETLRMTAMTQPCMFAFEMASAAVLSAHGVKADVAAGFSLGEIAAATYASVFSLEDGFRLVSERGRIMQEENGKARTAMSAVLRLSDERVETLAASFGNVFPVNYNCPGQVVVSGLEDEVSEFEKAVRSEGGRTMRLKVSGAFHSPFMKNASARFNEVLAGYEVASPAIPLYSDLTGKVYDERIRNLLAEQISSPVRWSAIIREMIGSGARIFIEIGPGRTLCNLVSRIDGDVRALSASGVADIGKILEVL